MDGKQFLDLLQQRRMAPTSLIDKMRAQVAVAKRPVIAATVARVFVEAGHLTAFQARQLIGGDDIEAKPSTNLSEDLRLPEPDELDFAPLEEFGHKPPPSYPGGLEPPPVQLTERLGSLDDPLDNLFAGSAPDPNLVQDVAYSSADGAGERIAGLPASFWIVLGLLGCTVAALIAVALLRR